MGNHSILDHQAINITAKDTWQALVTHDLPDGIAVKQIHLSELLHKSERLDVILPLSDLLTPSGLLKQTLELIATRTSRLGVWADTSTTIEQLDQLLASISDSENSDTAPPNSNNLLASLLTSVDLVVIHTPLFADGRNFSLAKHLRLQGYQGEIRVTGDFGRDQIAYLLRSGVDSFVIANEWLAEDIQSAFSVLPSAYNGNDAGQLPMFRT